MRQTISGLLAAFAVMTVSAAPAMACGAGAYGSPCSPCVAGYASSCAQSQVYVSPAPAYHQAGCNTGCGGWAYERLPDPVHQYYYVNQGPTYTGPGNFAPAPTYQESAVPGWGHRPYHYARRHTYARRYAPAPYHYGHRVLRRYY